MNIFHVVIQYLRYGYLMVKKKKIPLTNKEYMSYPNQENCHICFEKFEDFNHKKYRRVGDHCHR